MPKAAAESGVREHFGGGEPDTIDPVLAALIALRSGLAAGPDASLDTRAPVRP